MLDHLTGHFRRFSSMGVVSHGDKGGPSLFRLAVDQILPCGLEPYPTVLWSKVRSIMQRCNCVGGWGRALANEAVVEFVQGLGIFGIDLVGLEIPTPRVRESGRRASRCCELLDPRVALQDHG